MGQSINFFLKSEWNIEIWLEKLFKTPHLLGGEGLISKIFFDRNWMTYLDM